MIMETRRAADRVHEEALYLIKAVSWTENF